MGAAGVVQSIDNRRASPKGAAMEAWLDHAHAVALEHLGRTLEAHDEYLALSQRPKRPRGGLIDDALSRAATIDTRLGRHAEAVTHLRELLRWRYPSGGWQNDERPRFAHSAYRIAEILRDNLNDAVAARRAFEELASLPWTTPWRDAALWSAAQIAATEGDTQHACDLARRLRSQFKESRFARCTQEVCKTESPPALPCAGYILRGAGESAATPGND